MTCCYAVPDKVWTTDPDGNCWEILVVLSNDGAQHQSSACGPEKSTAPVGASGADAACC